MVENTPSGLKKYTVVQATPTHLVLVHNGVHVLVKRSRDGEFRLGSNSPTLKMVHDQFFQN